MIFFFLIILLHSFVEPQYQKAIIASGFKQVRDCTNLFVICLFMKLWAWSAPLPQHFFCTSHDCVHVRFLSINLCCVSRVCQLVWHMNALPSLSCIVQQILTTLLIEHWNIEVTLGCDAVDTYGHSVCAWLWNCGETCLMVYNWICWKKRGLYLSVCHCWWMLLIRQAQSGIIPHFSSHSLLFLCIILDSLHPFLAATMTLWLCDGFYSTFHFYFFQFCPN